MNILFYYPSSRSTVALSSLMIAFQQQGHTVFLLTHAEKGELHKEVAEHGVKTFSYPIKKNISFIFYRRHLSHLKKFIRDHKIDIVYSHLQQANLIAVFAQRSTKARIIICRHHSDSAYVEANQNARRTDRLINRYAKEFIAPSKKVFDQMTLVEKVDPKKIRLIPYAYDFSGYPQPDLKEVELIKEKYKAKLLLVCVARLIPEKRHKILFEVMRTLVNEKFDVKLMVLSEGSSRKELELYVKENKLEKDIFFLGHRKNVIDFLAAADLVVHISASEASNNLVKEAGLISKPVIACHDVGDFDDYLTNNENSILLSKENTKPELEQILRKIYSNEFSTADLGRHLKETVVDLFSLEKVLKLYDPLNKKD